MSESRKPMTENDPKRLSNPRVECCLRCGQPLHDHNLFDQGQCPEPQPAPREGLTAEQRELMREHAEAWHLPPRHEPGRCRGCDVLFALAEIDALKAENEGLHLVTQYRSDVASLRIENDTLRTLVAEMEAAAMDAPCSFDKPEGRFCTIDNPICKLHVSHDAARAALAKGEKA